MRSSFIKIVLFCVVLGLIRGTPSVEEISKAIDKVLILNNGIKNNRDIREFSISQESLEHFKVPLDKIQTASESQNSFFLEEAKKIKDSASPIFHLEKEDEGIESRYSGGMNYFDDIRNVHFASVQAKVSLVGGFVSDGYVHVYQLVNKLKGVLGEKFDARYQCSPLDNLKPFRMLAAKGRFPRCPENCLIKRRGGLHRFVSDDVRFCCCLELGFNGRAQTEVQKLHNTNLVIEYGIRRLKQTLLRKISLDFSIKLEEEDEEE